MSAATCSSKGRFAGAGEGVGHPALTALLEELVDLGAVGTAEVAEQLGREVAVPLGVESLGRRSQLVDVSGPAPTGLRWLDIVVLEQPVFFEAAQLLADGGRGERELSGHLQRVERSASLDQVEDGPPGRRQLLER